MGHKTALPLWMLAPLLVLTPALTCVSPRIMAALYIACGVLSVAAHCVQKHKLPNIDKTWLYAILAFVAYGCFGRLWTINPQETLDKTFALGGIFMLTACLHSILKTFTQHDITRIGKMLAIGFWLGIGVYVFEQNTNFMLYELVRGGHSADVIDVKENKAAYLIAIWAALAFPFYWGRITFGWVSAAMALVYVIFTAKSMSVQAILLGMPILFLALRYLPIRFNLRLAVLGTIALSVLMPLIAMQAYKVTDFNNADANGSIISRIEIWNQVAERVREKPLSGWGMDSASKLPNRGEVSVIPAYTVRGMQIAHLHPHNAPMQIWFELGGIGVAGFCMLCLLFMRRIEVLPTPAQKYAVFMWAVLFLNTLASWGIWQSWFICSLCFAVVFTGIAVNGIGYRPLCKRKGIYG